MYTFVRYDVAELFQNVMTSWHGNIFHITVSFSGETTGCYFFYNDNSQIARFMGPTWGLSGSRRPLMGPMLAPWTLLSGLLCLERWSLWWNRLKHRINMSTSEECRGRASCHFQKSVTSGCWWFQATQLYNQHQWALTGQTVLSWTRPRTQQARVI